MALINCPHCNNQISDKASKCPRCGNNIESEGLIKSYDSQITSSQENSPTEIKKKGISLGILIVSIIVALIIGIIGGYLLFSDDSGNDGSSSHASNEEYYQNALDDGYHHMTGKGGDWITYKVQNGKISEAAFDGFKADIVLNNNDSLILSIPNYRIFVNVANGNVKATDIINCENYKVPRMYHVIIPADTIQKSFKKLK